MNKKNKFLFALVLTLISSVTYSQTAKYDFNASVPLDPSVRHGTLKNGMQYYIKKNEKPKDRADFYIVHKVGALLETPEQNGLAHFVEHMAFNGLEHFPGKSMLNYFQDNGIVFGKDINAFTSYDVTAYNLSRIPTKKGMTDTALLVLRDWSNYIQMVPKEIDAERGVIREEWRTRRNANFRMSKITDKAKYNGSKSVLHDVIGSRSVIDTFHYETINKFYHDWYRTNLQAIIIVGDFDPEKMEKKVIELFSPIPESDNKKERYYVEIPNNDEPLISIATDAEASNVRTTIMYKHDIVKPENKNFGYLKMTYVRALYSKMFNNRLSELAQKEDAPFMQAYNYYGDFASTKAANNLITISGNTGTDKAIKTILLENKRIIKYGFTKGELERAKAEIIANDENAYTEKDNTVSETFVWQYFSNFMNNEPAPDIDWKHEFVTKIVPQITLDDVNKIAKDLYSEKNMVVLITAPKKKEVILPTEKEILAIIKDVSKAKIKPYKDNTSDAPLMAKRPSGSKLVKESTINGVTEWKFANGVTVIIKPTDYKKNEIQMRAFSPGGSSLVATEDLPSSELVTTIITNSGIADFSQIELEKKLSGKKAYVSPYIDKYEEGFQGSCITKDLETMLKMTYLYFTKPRKDKTAYNSLMKRYESSLQNAGSDPSARFGDSLSTYLLNNDPRRQPFNKETIKKVDFDKIYQIYNERFADATDWTFIFVGNIDLEYLKPVIGTYIGGLPAQGKTENFKDNKVRFNTNNIEKIIKIPAKENKSSVFIAFSGDIKYNGENSVNLKAMEYILGLRYTATIREEEGGSYGVDTQISMMKLPVEKYLAYAMFDCDPENAEKLAKIIYREIELLQKNGPTEVDLQKTIKYLRKDREEKLKKNGFWLNVLYEKYANNYDPSLKENYDKIVDKMTVETIKNAFKVIDTKKHLQLITKPVN